jgi:hypothetical protein
MYEWLRYVCFRVDGVVDTPRHAEQALLRRRGRRSSSGAGSGHGIAQDSGHGSVASSSKKSSNISSSIASSSISSTTIGNQIRRQSTQFLDQLRMHALIRLALPRQSMPDEKSLAWVDDDHVEG